MLYPANAKTHVRRAPGNQKNNYYEKNPLPITKLDFQTGVNLKEYQGSKYKLRLVEFTEDFVEEDWCQKGHVGYVLEGRMSIDFDGEILTYEAGDGIYINSGSEEKHKAIIAKGELVLMVLVEEL